MLGTRPLIVFSTPASDIVFHKLFTTIDGKPQAVNTPFVPLLSKNF